VSDDAVVESASLHLLPTASPAPWKRDMQSEKHPLDLIEQLSRVPTRKLRARTGSERRGAVMNIIITRRPRGIYVRREAEGQIYTLIGDQGLSSIHYLPRVLFPVEQGPRIFCGKCTSRHS
jgi:hypothetical protein